MSPVHLIIAISATVSVFLLTLVLFACRYKKMRNCCCCPAPHPVRRFHNLSDLIIEVETNEAVVLDGDDVKRISMKSLFPDLLKVSTTNDISDDQYLHDGGDLEEPLL
jgi:hypothetical protein